MPAGAGGPSTRNGNEDLREGSMKAYLALAMLVVMGFLGFKLLPPYINNYQLQDSIESIARFSSYAARKTADDVKKEVLEKAEEIGIELDASQVHVRKDSRAVNIEVRYTVEVPVPGYTFNLNFNPVAGNRVITAK
jgi:hypothetical protein